MISKMNASEYKKYHESFMENNDGSSLFHTSLCIMFTVQCSILIAMDRQRPPTQYLYEYFIIVLPMIAVHTILADYIYTLNAAIFAIILIKLILNYDKLQILKTFQEYNNFNRKHINSISIMRGLTYLITVFCILAVDFQAFPRYLAKTERYGYSLMDTGVGLFVLMSGLVHKDITKENYRKVIKGNSKFISVLICLGIGRFMTVKQFDYQEHITEYGVHWNFFFTLAVCKFTSTVLLYCSNRALLFSALTLALHEFRLSQGLQDWVFSNTPRNDIISANREGLSSCLGYTSLYLFAAFLRNELNDKTVRRYVVQLKLGAGAVCLWILSYYVDLYLPTSRTLANAGYCLYLEAILMSVIAVMYFLEAVSVDKDKKLYFDVPMILSAINANGLIYFLIANLTTGFINLSIRTLLMAVVPTLVILNVYMIVTIAFTVDLKNKGIKI